MKEHLALKRPQFFFITALQDCPYLPGRQERKIVTELGGATAPALHDRLSRAGFRRSHAICYTPSCPDCSACVAVRVDVARFRMHRWQRRIWNRYADLQIRWLTPRALSEHFHLFSRYQDGRHGGGDMASMGYYDYRSMIEDTPIDSGLLELREADGTLRAVCLVDFTHDGLSAVYSFYDTRRPDDSYGSFIVLWLIEEARQRGLPYLYLGYWVADSPKMAYKIRYQPLEGFRQGRWQPIEESDLADWGQSSACRTQDGSALPSAQILPLCEKK